MDPFTIRRLQHIMDGYIAVKVPHTVRSSVRLTYEWEGNQLTLVEERPDAEQRKWIGSAIAQFRLEQDKWHVYAKHSSSYWHSVASIAPQADFEQQLEQVELDVDGVFWVS